MPSGSGSSESAVVDVEYYESDLPCKRCGGTLRFRNEEQRGMCVGCNAEHDRVSWARHYIHTSSGARRSTTRGDEDDDG